MKDSTTPIRSNSMSLRRSLRVVHPQPTTLRQPSRSQSHAARPAAGATVVTPLRVDPFRHKKFPGYTVCRIHGLTATFADLIRLLRRENWQGPLPTDHVLRRARRDNATQITLEMSPREGISLRTLLGRLTLNGARLMTHPPLKNALPPRYDPLHVSFESGPGRVVSIEGMPYLTTPTELRHVLRGFRTVRNPDLQFHRVKQERDSSSWLVRCTTEEEAQRMVKTLHHTLYRPDQLGENYSIQAEIFH